MRKRKRVAKKPAKEARALFAPLSRAEPPTWQLQDAKARFSELVRRAQRDGPQRVTVRGENPVVVLTEEEYKRLAGRKRQPRSLSEIFRPLAELDLTREPDFGRDIDLK